MYTIVSGTERSGEDFGMNVQICSGQNKGVARW